MSLVGFKGKNHRQQVKRRGSLDHVDDRGTPPEIFNALNSEFGFTLDVAASRENAKCARFYTLEDDGLELSWAGERVWCNPPYSQCAKWVAKAYMQVYGTAVCDLVVMLLPANRCEQAWWQDLIEPGRRTGAIQVRFLRGRHRFVWPKGRVVPPKGDRPPFGLVVVIFQGGFSAEDEAENDYQQEHNA